MNRSWSRTSTHLLLTAALAATAACSSLQAGSDDFTPKQAHDDAESLVLGLLEAATGQQPDADDLDTLAKPRACVGMRGTDPHTAFFLGHFTGDHEGSAAEVYSAAVDHLEGPEAPDGLTVSASTDLEQTVVFTLETLEGSFEVTDSTWVLSLETRCAQVP